eukprot:scaffold52649_cov34-Phaeocystis_antarctica.AAC.1
MGTRTWKGAPGATLGGTVVAKQFPWGSVTWICWPGSTVLPSSGLSTCSSWNSAEPGSSGRTLDGSCSSCAFQLGVGAGAGAGMPYHLLSRTG